METVIIYLKTSQDFGDFAVMFDRSGYLDKLIKRKEDGLIKVITGVRRVGKSYLLNEIFYNYLLDSGIRRDHVIKFAFDSLKDVRSIGDDLVDRRGKPRKVDAKKFMDFIYGKVSGKGTWRSNPWVFVFDFELLKLDDHE